MSSMCAVHLRNIDLNLLLPLQALLEERSVTRAGKRVHLSQPAMSRALARLRETTGDPLLVRAGRGLVPTPRALELRGYCCPSCSRLLSVDCCAVGEPHPHDVKLDFSGASA